jgi:flagella basal body P-ring formation protein FlgA
MRKTAAGTGTGQLIKPGQTATLTWEQSGIRVVLPVTCLDGGGLGQLVRIRFKNGAQTLRAEVVGAGSLRAGL